MVSWRRIINPKPSKELLLADELGFKRIPSKTITIHTCSVCGKEDTWGESWKQWRSLLDEDNGFTPVTTCSNECRKVFEEKIGTAS